MDSNNSQPRKSAALPRDDAALATAVGRGAARVLAAYVRARRDCRRTMSRANVHDLRVATRRVEALLALFPQLGSRHADLRDAMAGAFRAAGRLRDVQLLLRAIKAGELGAVPPAFPGALRTRRRKLRRRLVAELVLATCAAPDAALRALARVTVEDAVARETKDTLAATLRRRLAAVRAAHARALRRITPDEAGSVHAARIALKRLRYAAEFLAPLLPDLQRVDLDPLAAEQAFLGTLSDRRSWLGLVDREIRRHPRRRQGLLALRERLECDVAARLARVHTLEGPVRVSRRRGPPAPAAS